MSTIGEGKSWKLKRSRSVVEVFILWLKTKMSFQNFTLLQPWGGGEQQKYHCIQFNLWLRYWGLLVLLCVWPRIFRFNSSTMKFIWEFTSKMFWIGFTRNPFFHKQIPFQWFLTSSQCLIVVLALNKRSNVWIFSNSRWCNILDTKPCGDYHSTMDVEATNLFEV